MVVYSYSPSPMLLTSLLRLLYNPKNAPTISLVIFPSCVCKSSALLLIMQKIICSAHDCHHNVDVICESVALEEAKGSDHGHARTTHDIYFHAWTHPPITQAISFSQKIIS